MTLLKKYICTVFVLVAIAAVPFDILAQNLFSFAEDGSSVIHNKSGAIFPATFGEYIRLEPQVIDKVGNNIAIGYSSRSSIRAEFTEYLRYKDISISKYYLDSKSAIVSMNPQLKLIAEDAESIVESATYQGNANFDGRLQSIISILLVTEESDWLIKIRVSFPFPQDGLSTDGDVQTFLGKLPMFYPKVIKQN